MNLIIVKSINIRILIIALFKRNCIFEYLIPISNDFYKFLINHFYLKSVIFRRVKMGQIKNKNGIFLYGLSVQKTNAEIFNRRRKIYNKSSNYFLNINSDVVLNHIIWKRKVRTNLLIEYYNYKKNKYKNNFKKIILILNQKKDSNLTNFSNKLNNFLLIESLRIILFILSKLLDLIYPKKFPKVKNKIKVNKLILSSEDWPKTKNYLFYRNQLSLSKHLSDNKSFAVIDYKKKMIRMKGKSFKIKSGPFYEYIIILRKMLPSINEYIKVNYELRILQLLRVLRITYNMWSFTRRISAKNYLFNYFSSETSSLLILSMFHKAKSFFYQGTLQGLIYPDMHSPYASPISFTRKNEEMYLSRSLEIENIFVEPKRMSYPYNAKLKKYKVNKFRKELNKKFDLTIAYFDENYPSENATNKCEFFSFYEDLKEEIKILLEFLNKNPKVAILSKSKYVAGNGRVFNPLDLILKNEDLKSIYNPHQFFEISKKSPYSNRNIISPLEIGNIVDICISTSLGGTAAYEAASSGCRVFLIKSGMSVYDELISDKVLYDSLDEIIKKIYEININRDNLEKSDLGIFKTTTLD